MTSRSTIVTIAVAAVLVTAVEWLVGMYLCEGAFVYPLDDTYIHMAMARQMASDGTWGFEPGVYAFASSSPLWTVLLSLTFLVVGCREWIPLVYANLFAALAVSVAVDVWRRLGLSPRRQLVFGLLLVLCVPFIALANLGMEHALHAACVSCIIASALEVFRGAGSSRAYVTLCVAVFLATAARYETIFLAAPLSLLLLLNGRWRTSFAVVLSAALPILVYGAYALSHGGYFFPTSLILKTGGGSEAFVRGVSNFLVNVSPDTIHAYVLIVLMFSMASLPWLERWTRIVALAVALSIGGHMVFAQLGWLYRYECYLMLSGLMLIPLAFKDCGLSKKETPRFDVLRFAPLFLSVLLASPFVIRGVEANIDVVLAQREIYEQQVQMGRIFASLPDSQKGPVAVNDLGSVAWQAGVHVLDIWGLGSDDVAKLKISRQMRQGQYAELFRTHGIRYAAFYPTWYSPAQLSPVLKPVAVLRTNARVICGGREVLLCVTDEKDIVPFKNSLKAYSPTLPRAVELSMCE